jgi:two-component system response regulator
LKGAQISAPDVLLVEDSRTTAELFVFVFEASKSGATIQVVRDGVEALDFLLGGATQSEGARNTLPRLLLLDLHMPRLDGIEVLKRLRADERTRSLPVVFFSSSDDESDEREAYRLGADGYVCKPVGFEEFRATIAQIESTWLKARGTPHLPPG